MTQQPPKSTLPVLPDFAVLWVDDDQKAARTSISSVEQWFITSHAEMKMEIKTAQSVKEALDTFLDNPFDLVVTDNNLGKDKPNGSVLVNRLRRRSTYIDIIYYTRLPAIPPDIEKKVSNAGFTCLVKDAELVATTEKIIQDRLDRLEKVSYLRGMVISAFIDVEDEMNELLLRYFPLEGERQRNFRTSILQNQNMSFQAKIEALLMIIHGKLTYRKKDGMLQPFHTLDYETVEEGVRGLREIAKQRNYLAHCMILPEDKLQLVTMGTTLEYSRKDIKSILEQIRQCSRFLATLDSCLGGRESMASVATQTDEEAKADGKPRRIGDTSTK